MRPRGPGWRAPVGEWSCAFSGLVSGAFQEDDPGHPAELLPLRLGVQLSAEIPNARDRHRSLETERFVPHRAELRFAPPQWLEALFTLRRPQSTRGVSGRH